MINPQQCPSCDARNPADAAWCTQCYESLVSEPASVPAGAQGATTATPPSPPTAPGRAGTVGDDLLPLPEEDRGGPGTTSTGRGESLAAGDGRFRRGPAGLEWCCEVCDEWNPIDLTSCAACGGPFLRDEADDEETPAVDPSLLAVATVVLPGAGHALLGHNAQAFWRALLAIVWGGGGILLLLRALATGQPVLPAVPLLLGWLTLVVTSVNDVLVARGASGRVLLGGRTLLWLVIGVVGATMGAVFVGAFGAFNG